MARAVGTVTHTVRTEHTAKAVGSGDLDVFATPMLLAWC
jgi:fluoroacetyl-CoA thioesterase